VQNHKLFEVA